MTGILLVTHGGFSKGILEAMELICGRQENVEALSLNISDDVETLADQVKSRVESMNQGDGVLILVDMLGGSPANVSARLMMEDGVACITGLNFPMVLEAVGSRESCPFSELVPLCMESGAAGIVDLKARLREFTAQAT